MTNVKVLREARGISQADLADRIGVARSTVAMWETDQNTPPTKILLSLADALQCSVDDLLSLDHSTEGGFTHADT